MSNWQPIETAPKDGETYVLVYSPWAGHISIARYLAGRGRDVWASDYGTVLFEKYELSHWMPLPEPPKEPKE